MNYTTHLLFILISITSLLCSTAAEPINTTAVYAFGDAIFDTGNNNGLRTICRADHPPYSAELHDTISFGRFSNGMLPADILVHDLGLKPLMHPYLNVQTAPCGPASASPPRARASTISRPMRSGCSP